jgi:hypothetical protein
VFYVPCVQDDSVVLVPELECPWSESLISDDCPLPWGCELVLILVALHSSENQVSDLELVASHVLLVIAPQGLLVSSRM